MAQRRTASNSAWGYAGDVITACNCDWGCPCNFNAPPTKGHCEGGWVIKVKAGHCDSLKLDSLSFALMAKWPGAIHEGGGTAKIWIDEAASTEQRSALERIVKGELKGKPWPIFATTFDQWLETSFVHFEWKLDAENSHYRAGDEVRAFLEPVRNPVTGLETKAKIILPDALVCNEINVTTSKTFSVFTKGLKFTAPGKNAWYGTVKHSS